MTCLSAEGLAKRFGSRTVVDDVSLAVNSGEVVGFLGPNGAGKSTSFHMIVGLIPADGGTVHLDGVDLTNRPMHARARLGLGYLPQEPSVFRKLSVEQNLLAILELSRDLDAETRALWAVRLMQAFGVEHLRRERGENLSGGERRRVELARALAARPRYMLLDEPFAGVDPITISEIHGLIRQLRERGIGVLVTDHNVRETLGICDRGYIVNEGRIICHGRPDTIADDPMVRDVYLGQDFVL
ncbi:MAG: LPS export ABC transporter ATP-binding protein [Immundisolibacterales bacterium]|nr:LPS export ABC transporter ATP-binding protein [Immundisolibacterales bacterium]